MSRRLLFVVALMTAVVVALAAPVFETCQPGSAVGRVISACPATREPGIYLVTVSARRT
jgi:hypothetical protein